MRFAMAFMACAAGCALVVGSKERVLREGGAPEATSCSTCASTESACRADCDSALASCEQQCVKGPKGAPCKTSCQTTADACHASCASNCSSCESQLGCPTTCTGG